ncbi:MAG: hypothetical protein ABTQ27_06450 [Amaricoccus sp.]|uniref:hypothetical protein n=1 Tax=Amaricoccus sp. TaxID=1872485 RepID=UPI00331639D2
MKFVDGSWELVTGGQVPVKEGTEAELRVPAKSITDQSFLRKMTQEGAILILAIGTPLRALLSPKDRSDIPDEVTQHLLPIADIRKQIGLLASPERFASDSCFVEVKLSGPTDAQARHLEFKDGGLWLIFEGAVPTDLRSSTIELPAGVASEGAISLNHAFTLLSEVYEPWRKAHTGSVYERFYYLESDGKWYPLALLRDAGIAQQEQKIAKDLWASFLARCKAR